MLKLDDECLKLWNKQQTKLDTHEINFFLPIFYVQKVKQAAHVLSKEVVVDETTPIPATPADVDAKAEVPPEEEKRQIWTTEEFNKLVLETGKIEVWVNH